ncbi:MAG: HAMP domain-containing histidine kinase, partial [Chloroflexi bacterium]|nr:HAMP domain-containing histidine kinase [Chloroflexota bacterium]
MNLFGRARWRLARWNLVVIAATLVLVCAAMYGALYQGLLAQLDGSLSSQADEAMHEAGDDQAHFGREGYEGGFFALVVDARGAVLDNPQQVQLRTLGLASTGEPHFETIDLNGQATRLYVAPLTSGSWSGSNLVIGESLAPVESALHRVLLVVLSVGGVSLAAALLSAWFLAGKALTPVQEAFRRQQEFTADASHELRTPLTVMRSAAELLGQHEDEPVRQNADLLEDIRAEIDRLERLAADLLTLARSDAGHLELAVGDLDLGVLATHVVRRLGPLASARQVTLKVSASKALPVEGDPDRLEQVLVILLDNAVKHTPSGGQVEIG